MYESQNQSVAPLIRRRDRGLRIARTSRVQQKTEGLWVVPSQSHAGAYIVDMRELSCTCPDFSENAVTKCKHIFATEFVVVGVSAELAEALTKEAVPEPPHTQNWSDYNAAQCKEREIFPVVLGSLCDGIVQSPQVGPGQRRLPLRDVVFANVMKVYTTLSGRRADTDIRQCKKNGHTETAPSYNTLFRYMGSPIITPVLGTLIKEAAAPLVGVEGGERGFSADATGFSTCCYDRWYDYKWGREAKHQIYVKAHAMFGNKSNIVTSVEVSRGYANDAPFMEKLVDGTAERFDLKGAVVSADKAYLSYDNLDYIARHGARPLIPMKDNSTDGGSEQWSRLYHLFKYQELEFSRLYHQRSNSEAGFSMIKRKFGTHLRSRKFESQTNELLAKFLCHNVVVLVHEMHALGVNPKLWVESNPIIVGPSD